jgi:hypothetical protein
VNPRTVIPAILAALCVVLFLAWRWQGRLERGLAEIVVPCASRGEALDRAGAYAREHGGALAPILGTGSMAPLIPAARAGLDPLSTQVAVGVTVPGATFESVVACQPCIYQPAWARGAFVLHLTSDRHGAGWIMTGLHNERYESWEPMTAAIYRGTVARIFTWPQ